MRWLIQLDGDEFEQALGDGEGQGSLACWSPWGHKQLDMTDWTTTAVLYCLYTVSLLRLKKFRWNRVVCRVKLSSFPVWLSFCNFLFLDILTFSVDQITKVKVQFREYYVNEAIIMGYFIVVTSCFLNSCNLLSTLTRHFSCVLIVASTGQGNVDGSLGVNHSCWGNSSLHLNFYCESLIQFSYLKFCLYLFWHFLSCLYSHSLSEKLKTNKQKIMIKG